MSLIVDAFCGGGGASTGIEMALGRSPDVAVNHDAQAIAMHEANHPNTRHLRGNVWDANPREVCGDEPVDLLWASPSCVHFSRAKGGPLNRATALKVRSLAWVIVRWARDVRPRVIVMENVVEVLGWGPLLNDGRPCPRRKGRTFNLWQRKLEAEGYVVEWRELRACDYGAPTSRNRLFLVARCDGAPIVWPEPTHGRGRIPYRTAADCIDFSIPCPSIFGRRKPLSEATLRRIARGLRKFVLESGDPFVIPLTHQGSDRVHDIREPLRTVTCANRGELALVAPTLIHQSNGEREGQAPRIYDIQKPIGTVVAGGVKHALVTAFLAKHFGGHGTPGQSLQIPLGTVTCKDHHALVHCQLKGVTNDRTRRCAANDRRGRLRGASRRDDLEVEKPQHDTALRAASDKGQGKAGLHTRDSLVVREAIHGLCTSTCLDDLARSDPCRVADQPQERRQGRQPSRQPRSRLTLRERSTRVRHGAASPNGRGGGSKGAGVCTSSPWPSVFGHRDEVGRFANNSVQRSSEVEAFVARYVDTDGARQLTLTETGRFGLVTVHGEPFEIADIGMRLLTPRELFNAQGFPASYEIAPLIDGKPLTKTAQIRMAGNSVAPDVAAAIVAANVGRKAVVAA